MASPTDWLLHKQGEVWVLGFAFVSPHMGNGHFKHEHPCEQQKKGVFSIWTPAGCSLTLVLAYAWGMGTEMQKGEAIEWPVMPFTMEDYEGHFGKVLSAELGEGSAKISVAFHNRAGL